MTQTYAYRPRFVDIRVRPPKPEAAQPEARACDWAGCAREAGCRAPMGPKQLGEFYWFCPEHAAAYNRNWDFFAEMDEAARADFQASAAHGHRPTWKTGTGGRAHAAAGRAKTNWAEAFADTFGLFGARPSGRKAEPDAPRARRLGRLETAAFETLGLTVSADAATVRAAYADLVKRFHPDANGGDRSTEDRLTQVIRAYQTLKKAGYG